MIKNNKEIVNNNFMPDFSILINEFPELKKYTIKNDDTEAFSFDWSDNDKMYIKILF